MNYFEKLPEELAAEIFSRLCVHELRCILPQVCRSWAELAKSRVIWDRVVVQFEVFPLKNIAHENSIKGEEAIRSFVKSSPFIRQISFIGRGSEEFYLEVLSLLQETGTCVRFLALETLQKQKIIDKLVEFTSLESLEIFFLGQKPMRTILRIENEDEIVKDNFDFSKFSNLLRLRTLKISRVHKKTFHSLMKHAQQVQNLTLMESKINCFEDVGDLLNNLRSLCLRLDEIDLGSLEVIKRMPNLRSFHAIDYSPSEETLTFLSELPEILETVRLSELHTAPVLTGSALVKFFKTPLQISRMSLIRSRITDEGAYYIRRNCPKLVELRIEVINNGNEEDMGRLTDNGILHLLHLDNLRKLTIEKNSEDLLLLGRNKWRWHKCDPDQPCPEGFFRLLDDWNHVRFNIDVE